MPSNKERQSDCIRDCLDDIVLGSIETVPLPGFDQEDVCLLCKLQTGDCDGAKENRLEQGGATLTGLLSHAEWLFHNSQGTPQMNQAKDIHSAMQHYIQGDRERLGFLKDLSPDDVYNHFFYDHNRRHPPKTKERVERILLSMLNVGIQSCCNKQDDGKTTLIRHDAMVILQIVDRLTKIQAATK